MLCVRGSDWDEKVTIFTVPKNPFHKGKLLPEKTHKAVNASDDETNGTISLKELKTDFIFEILIEYFMTNTKK